MATVQLTATLTRGSGATEDVTDSATWTSSAPTIATVSDGLVTAVEVGTATITATALGQSGTSEITVVDSPEGLAVAPGSASVELD
ncbi:Ig-like domain-containing protein [Streptomyces sp. SM12]|uniref:Ig-like domain-containing protein n=1 Tax=Streptomyces sp. SM12 TaxID=1071602 RepID=UPI000CD5165F|nr:Ig-like domain-containing protein [Streptomyces sp. SM12]